MQFRIVALRAASLSLPFRTFSSQAWRKVGSVEGVNPLSTRVACESHHRPVPELRSPNDSTVGNPKSLETLVITAAMISVGRKVNFLVRLSVGTLTAMWTNKV